MTSRAGSEQGGRKNNSPARRRQLADATLQVLGTSGSRGLTHRAVDQAAGLPTGSVNYFGPTREELLRLALEEVFRYDLTLSSDAVAKGGAGRDDLVLGIVALVDAMTDRRSKPRTIARMELLLEAQRRPEFRTIFDNQRGEFVAMATQILASAGCQHSELHADALVSFIDALVKRQLLIAEPLSSAQLQNVVAAHLAGC
ncbi:TetR family transcriptional regulator [Jatrophihabitans sp. GAS493]|uniref:TetR/AcrR family transcriptional regulator n=1 Tax=Jatrophihabitans sp. GAS493 TaxID=1907575 RepID=UPI000BB96D9A|nr:TetR/AcrR family transcriptional regulator [Jatrophihabitans sp. GAS493]SOD73656.1 TetR family transcriptional regulator [Jatrophihabitans sp. GAS493]